MDLTQANLKKIRAIKRDKESFFITEAQAAAIENSKKMRDDFVKIIDRDGKVIYWGDPKQIIEFREDLSEIHRLQAQEREQEQALETRRYMKNDAEKRKWSKEKMKEEGQLDWYNLCIAEAKDQMETAIKKEWVGSTFVKKYALCLWRKKNRCPYR